MVVFIKMTCRKFRTGEQEQDKTEIAEGRSFVYLLTFLKLVFR